MMPFLSRDSDAVALRMHDIRKAFGATLALDGVDFQVRRGEVHALVGENGAGKSTLMKILSGALLPDAGSMELDGNRFAPRNPLDARHRGISMIYQELSLVPHLSVQENVLLGMEPSRWGILDWKKMRETTRRALEELEHGDIDPATPVHRLSVAQQQLVEISRAVAIGCQVLLLDEPTSSLSQQDVERLFQLIGRLRDQGHAIVYISHFLEEVKRISDSFTVLRDGRSVGSGITGETSTEAIISMMVGRTVEELYPRSPRTPGEVVLRIEGVSGERKPQSASLQLHRGEVLGIAGLVGAGRTEMLRVLFGLDPMTGGKIQFGRKKGYASPGRRWKQGVGMVSENRKEEGLAVSLSVADNVTLSRLDGLGPAGWVMPSRQNEATWRWIERLDIRAKNASQKVVDLSGGNQQKVAVARLLHHEVDILLLDEPTRGIDVGAKATIYRLIDDLASGRAADGTKRTPKAILMVSSYLPELMGICDRVAVMCRGKLGPAYPVDRIDEQQLMQEATGMGGA